MLALILIAFAIGGATLGISLAGGNLPAMTAGLALIATAALAATRRHGDRQAVAVQAQNEADGPEQCTDTEPFPQARAQPLHRRVLARLLGIRLDTPQAPSEPTGPALPARMSAAHEPHAPRTRVIRPAKRQPLGDGPHQPAGGPGMYDLADGVPFAVRADEED